MNAKQVIEVTRDAVRAVQQKGQTQIATDRLLFFLKEIEKVSEVGGSKSVTTEGEIAHFKAAHEASLAQYKATADADLEMFRSVIQAGLTARRSAIVINGGAAVALLAFLGHVSTGQQDKELVVALANAIVLFVFGVLSGGVADGITYLTQFHYRHNRPKLGNLFNGFSIVLIMASHVLFAFGAFQAYGAFCK